MARLCCWHVCHRLPPCKRNTLGRPSRDRVKIRLRPNLRSSLESSTSGSSSKTLTNNPISLLSKRRRRRRRSLSKLKTIWWNICSANQFLPSSSPLENRGFLVRVSHPKTCRSWWREQRHTTVVCLPYKLVEGCHITAVAIQAAPKPEQSVCFWDFNPRFKKCPAGRSGVERHILSYIFHSQNIKKKTLRKPRKVETMERNRVVTTRGLNYWFLPKDLHPWTIHAVTCRFALDLPESAILVKFIQMKHLVESLAGITSFGKGPATLTTARVDRSTY